MEWYPAAGGKRHSGNHKAHAAAAVKYVLHMDIRLNTLVYCELGGHGTSRRHLGHHSSVQLTDQTCYAIRAAVSFQKES